MAPDRKGRLPEARTFSPDIGRTVRVSLAGKGGFVAVDIEVECLRVTSPWDTAVLPLHPSVEQVESVLAGCVLAGAVLHQDGRRVPPWLDEDPTENLEDGTGARNANPAWRVIVHEWAEAIAAWAAGLQEEQ